MKFWLENYFEDFSSDLIQILTDFLEHTASATGNAKLSIAIKAIISKKTKARTSSDCSDGSFERTNSLESLEFNPPNSSSWIFFSG